jgi:hypothetical protein
VVAPEDHGAEEDEGGVDVEQQRGERRIDARERPEVAAGLGCVADGAERESGEDGAAASRR